MNNYFEKYKKSKLCLYKMIGQFITTYIKKDDLNKLGLKSDMEYFNVGNYVDVCYHNFSSEGLLAWDYLDLKKDFITHDELWDLMGNIKYEIEDNNIDYQEKYLKNSILLIDLTKMYYGRKYKISDAKEMNIIFHDDDEFDDEVLTCFHMFEGAGESVWNLFDIDKPIVGRSTFDNMRNEFCKELLKKKEKIKKLTNNNQ